MPALNIFNYLKKIFKARLNFVPISSFFHLNLIGYKTPLVGITDDGGYLNHILNDLFCFIACYLGKSSTHHECT